MGVKDQLAAAAVQHGAQAIAHGGLGLAARAVRLWVYVWLTPAALALVVGVISAMSQTRYPVHESVSAAFGLCAGILIFWFFPAMLATAVAMTIFAAFRYR